MVDIASKRNFDSLSCPTAWGIKKFQFPTRKAHIRSGSKIGWAFNRAIYHSLRLISHMAFEADMNRWWADKQHILGGPQEGE
jgi:hypothetical protein